MATKKKKKGANPFANLKKSNTPPPFAAGAAGVGAPPPFKKGGKVKTSKKK